MTKKELLEILKKKNLYDEEHIKRLDREWKEFKRYERITHTNLLEEIKKNNATPNKNILIWYLLDFIKEDPVGNPLEYQMIEGKSPDIDLDFEDDLRGEVINYLKRRFGYDHVAQVSNIVKYSVKSAFQDAARIHSIPFQEALKVSKTINDDNWNESPYYETYKDVFKFTEVLLGQMRNFGRHAAAVIITDKPVYRYVPVQYNQDDDILLTEFPGEAVTSIKLLKLDILGLATLKIIKDTITFVKKRHNISIDLDQIDFNDKSVYELFSKGLTTSVFQFESASMKGYLQQLKPETLEDLTAMNALFRPGSIPIINNYIKRRHGKEKIKYDHPILEQVLKSTYGLLIYQEQTIMIAHLASGMSLGRADILRRYLEKWNTKYKNDIKLKQKWEKEFKDGCRKNGISRIDADFLWQYLIKQSGYSFNKSHALSYAIIAYYTAWLKVHFPVEFMCASLNSDKTPIGNLISECKQLGIKVLYPDINKSQPEFSILDDKTIIYGLSSVKNCGTVPSKIISKNAPYTDVDDFFNKIKNSKNGGKVNKRVIDSLIKSGAFESIYKNRKVLLHNYDKWRKNKEKLKFTEFIKKKDLWEEDFSEEEKLQFLVELLTLDISSIIIEEQRDIILRLEKNVSKEDVVGVISNFTTKKDKNGNLMAFVSIRDRHQVKRYPMFSRQYAQHGGKLEQGKILIFRMMKLKGEDKAIKSIIKPNI